jgi:undecaprenyl-diphosphatase
MQNSGFLDQFQNQLAGVACRLGKLDDNLKGLVIKPKSGMMDLYFKFFSLSGKEPTTISLSLLSAGLLLSRRHKTEAFSMLAAVGGGWALNQLVKRTIRRPRPLSLNTLRNHSKTYSFPSAHTNLAVCYYGTLAWLGLKFFKRPLARVLWLLTILFLMVMIGQSRVYRKEHYPSDVIAGYFFGSLWLTIVLTGVNFYQTRQKAK